MRVLLVEPYYGGSHGAWADGYVASSRHDVELLTHEAQFWRWRLQGAHLTLAEELVARNDRFDVVLASSMLDLAGFLGAARSVLSAVPAAVFFHENQLAYSTDSGGREEHAVALINWQSAAVADRVFFNSTFHRDRFFAEVPVLHNRFPDRQHGSLLGRVEQASSVLPVGVDLQRLDEVATPAGDESPLLLWNHRWDRDKGPGEFAALVTDLFEAGVDFRLALAGEQFVTDPEEFSALGSLLGDQLIHYGFADDDRYVELLRAADVVVSTAHQEFFGVALTEAVYAGAFPVVPNRLVYPERISDRFHERCLYDGHGDLVAKTRWALEHAAAARLIAADQHEVMAAYDWSVVAPIYDDVLEEMASGR